MKKTLYINDEAWEVLKLKKNKSRYVCDLIIMDSKRVANEASIDEIKHMLLDLLDSGRLVSVKTDDSEYGIQDILNM